MVNFVIVLEYLSICLTFVALILLLNGDGAREQKLLIFIMCGSLVQNVGYLLELIAPTVEAAVAAVTVENVGSAFVPLCYCWFIYTYCYAAPPKKLLRVLGAINFLILPTVFFNWNGLFYQQFEWLSTEDGFHYISISYGPLYLVFLFTRIITPYALCIFTLVRAIRLRSDREVSRQYKTILGISTLETPRPGRSVLAAARVLGSAALASVPLESVALGSVILETVSSGSVPLTSVILGPVMKSPVSLGFVAGRPFVYGPFRGNNFISALFGHGLFHRSSLVLNLFGLDLFRLKFFGRHLFHRRSFAPDLHILLFRIHRNLGLTVFGRFRPGLNRRLGRHHLHGRCGRRRCQRLNPHIGLGFFLAAVSSVISAAGTVLGPVVRSALSLAFVRSPLSGPLSLHLGILGIAHKNNGLLLFGRFCRCLRCPGRLCPFPDGSLGCPLFYRFFSCFLTDVSSAFFLFRRVGFFRSTLYTLAECLPHQRRGFLIYGTLCSLCFYSFSLQKAQYVFALHL